MEVIELSWWEVFRVELARRIIGASLWRKLCRMKLCPQHLADTLEKHGLGHGLE